MFHTLNDSHADGEWDYKSRDFEKEKTISLVLSGLIFMSLESAQPCE